MYPGGIRELGDITAATVEATREQDESERSGAGAHATANAAAGDASIRRMLVATNNGSLNLRSAPSFGDNVSGHLARGAAVDVSGAESSGFVTVRDGAGHHGWVAARYLRDESAPMPKYTAPHKPSPAARTATVLKASTATTTGARSRSRPS